MLFLFGGIALLAGLLLLVYLFVHANPARLARLAKWFGIGAAAVVVIALLILTEGRIAVLLLPFVPLIPALRRLLSRFQAPTGAPTGASSTVETSYIRMRLDHETGAMSGTVLRGRFAGMRIDELDRAQVIDVLRECRAADEEGARLVEAYLDRFHPNWRDTMRGERAGPPPPRGGTDMTVDEAYAILGLVPGAAPEVIKAAHHRLMKQLHPDHGGTDYLATQINRARDVLLREPHAD